MKKLVRRIVNSYVSFSDAPPRPTGIDALDVAPLKISLLGTCQVRRLVRGAVGTPHRIRHLLMSSHPHAEIPQPAPDDDLAVVGLSLRQILAEASGLKLPAADMAIARLSGEDEARALVDACVQMMTPLIERIHVAMAGRPALFLGFFEPQGNYLGALQNPYALTAPREFVRALNRAMADALDPLPTSYFFEINDILNTVGRKLLHDDVVLHGTHASFINSSDFQLDTKRLSPPQMLSSAIESERALRNISALFFEKVGAFHRILKPEAPVKLVICDLDDTLWRGIAAETEELADDDRIEGWPLGLVEALLYFKARGGLLAICSKNDLDETRERFDRIYRGAISLDDFAAVRINWQPKSANISEILGETNLLAQNALFIDDNPREVSEVKASHPDLRCLGTDHYNWRNTVLFAPEMQVAAISSESARRTEMVKAAAARTTQMAVAGASGASREAWLKSLDLNQTLDLVADTRSRHYERTFELINKTNQFNTTGKRWSASEFERFLKDGGVAIVSSLRDNQVDNGLISVCLVKDTQIIQMVLSCRVFGLGAETVVAAAAIDRILQNADTVRSEIIDTGRNATCHDFFLKLGFEPVDGGFQMRRRIDPPEHIQVTRSFR